VGLVKPVARRVLGNGGRAQNYRPGLGRGRAEFRARGIFDRRNGEFSTGLDNAARASPQRGGRMYNGLEPGSQNGIPD